MPSSPPIVLTFAASDPTGGAGLQADLLAIAGMRCYAASVVTAVTVQDTRGVERVLPVDAEWVTDQARRLLDDMPVAAFKLGVLASRPNILAVAQILSAHPRLPVVFDPVLASGRGDALASEEMLEAMRGELLCRSTVATPNSLEARRLARAAQGEDLADSARRLIALGCGHVLVTGTHEPGTEVCNRLYAADGLRREDRWRRLPGEYHGSGCTLASAIAAALAAGSSVEDAVALGQAFAYEALLHAFGAGRGQLLPDRMFALRGAAHAAPAGESHR